MHFNPYNLIEFYVGEITGTTPQTVSIYTDSNNSIPIQVSEGNKWYTYVLPKNKGLDMVEGDSVKKVVVKADINTNGNTIIPDYTVEASFKGSNTSKVTNMDTMFYGCSGLTSLDLRYFNTSNVTDMNYMFYNCNSLTSLDLSSFDTSKVNSMISMFDKCSSLTSLDLRYFNTSNVTDMDSMFYDCSSLTSLYLRNFNTSKVNSMDRMFYGCSKLETLDLSGWNTSNVTSMGNMFDGCTSLTSIRMIGCEQPTIDKIAAVKPSSANIETT